MNVVIVFMIVIAVVYGIWNQSKNKGGQTVVLAQTSPREMTGAVSYAELSDEDLKMIQTQ